MARKKEETVSNPVISNSELEQLKAKIASLEAQVQQKDPFEEIRKAKNRNMSDVAGITYRQFTDHKKVSMYHTNGIHIGKKVGPLHPGNIESTFERFRAKGIILSINPPTPEQVSGYMKTEEYKALEKKQRQVKATRFRGGETREDVKRLTDAMVKIAGLSPNDVINMKPQEAMQ